MVWNPFKQSANLEQPRAGAWRVLGARTHLAAILCVSLISALASGLLVKPSFTEAQQQEGAKEKLQTRPFDWVPPQVDTPLHSWIPSPPCEISHVLEKAGAQANALFDSLQSFDADEQIRYQAADRMGQVRESRVGTFDYVVVFKQGVSGLSVEESRLPSHRSHLLPAFTQDVGLAGMALLFLPEMQGDYEMTCEGTTESFGQPAWVVHFRQRMDKPSHSLSFRKKDTVYPARLKGRAWIVAESGDVEHMELSLMDQLPEAGVRKWYLALNYAPVDFHAQQVRLWLPQTADAYCEYETRRVISYHTFTNFRRFHVETSEETNKPGNP